ncbi:MAG: glutamate racemase [Eubacteriales bacterium]|jgi:glutamate racemase|nr:glutamate racemase [Eubacteriales bacterium]
MPSNAPIGFLDSGVGGLSVLNAARRVLPHEDFIMFGDSANAPYGTRPEHEVILLARRAARRLLDEGIKALVIACNTATGYAGETLKKELNIPVIGILPAVKAGQAMRTQGEILVMATPGTCQSAPFMQSLETDGDNVVPLPCPGLMEFVERGELGSEKLNTFLENLLAPYRERDIDVVALGCTHYPFLEKALRPFFPNAKMIDASDLTVQNLILALKEHDLLNDSPTKGTTRLMTSAGDDTLKVMRSLLRE